MIIGIEGTIEKKEPMAVHLNCNGLIYEVFISINSSTALDNKKAKLHTTQIIREDAHTLYGFVELSEKQMFDQLIKINGVGPKVGLAICSTYTPSSFVQIVEAKDVNALKRVPGIGPKGASRILVELSNFIVDEGGSASNTSPARGEASMALESLGFKKDQINKVISSIESDDTSEILKLALKKLQKL